MAREADAGFVLMDERRGRHAAEKLGIKPLGLLGILVLAKREGIISEVRPILDDLVGRAGFRVGNDLFERILRQVSEL